MENYIMSSVEIDMDFIDRKADEYEESYQMSDEEQKGFEDHITEEKDDEEEEVLYETTDDVLINTLFDTCFGMTSKESKSNRRASKKRKAKKVIHLYDGKVEELANRWGAKFVRGVK